MAFKKSAIFLQNACLQHRYIRSKDLSNIVERPERLRAVNIGLAAALSRLGELVTKPTELDKTNTDSDDLASTLDKLKLEPSSTPLSRLENTQIIQSVAKLDFLHNSAVKFIHGDIDRDVYLENLSSWVKESFDRITKGQSEIPQGYSQGDLYLCPESLVAIEGALGTVCEAVDEVVSSNSVHRAFVAIRPPGHHCGEDTPSGFCFVNNVAVAVAHAHLQHRMNRHVILDIDLHHGNGTQSIVWQINEETYRQKLEQEAGAPPTPRPGPQIYYGSVHDVLSYPCEDGKVELVQAASTSIHDCHGQFVENVHLQTYTSEDHFWTELYEKRYKKIIHKAQEFLDATGGAGDDVMIFISCGMDACEHEYESMSRHNRKVPTSYYFRFARDVCALSDKYAGGRVISVLEGGYSDRALTSGAMAHFVGLTDVPESVNVDESWWNVDNLVELEKATKKRRGGRPSLTTPGTTPKWIERTLEILAPLDNGGTATKRKQPTPPTNPRTLRDRTKTSRATTPTPPTVQTKGIVPMTKVKGKGSSTELKADDENLNEVDIVQKKLPRVILKLGKAEVESGSGLS